MPYNKREVKASARERKNMENIKKMTFNELQILYDEVNEELKQRKHEQLISLKEELQAVLMAIKEIDPHYVLIDNCCVCYDAEDLLEEIEIL